MIEILVTIGVIFVFIGLVYLIERWLGGGQKKERYEITAGKRNTWAASLIRSIITLAVVALASLVSIAAAIWAMTHPNTPLANIIVISIILLVSLGVLAEWLGLIGGIIAGLIWVLKQASRLLHTIYNAFKGFR